MGIRIKIRGINAQEIIFKPIHVCRKMSIFIYFILLLFINFIKIYEQIITNKRTDKSIQYYTDIIDKAVFDSPIPFLKKYTTI